MFLVCEDLTSGEASRSGGFDDRGESEALAGTFQEYAETFLQIRPAATEDGVPKLMEILADRDFGVHDDRTTP
ncbi:MAG TPA: hypothetical protein PLX89_17330 [Verrucomicrobiota bacterium]|nr:hypothetical protein [Verrucomicrobiota bacterium]